ncbi:DNA polymerase III subunit gamma/tau, partial [Staphylococcus aureus]|nr:DNA polymerase III subunit gamma/tau [Staphylococcus aureus]
PENVQTVATTSVASEPNNEVLLQRMEQLENELKTLKSQGVVANSAKPQAKKTASKGPQSKNAFSMQQIAKVLDKANKEDIKQLKDHWQEVIDHA